MNNRCMQDQQNTHRRLKKKNNNKIKKKIHVNGPNNPARSVIMTFADSWGRGDTPWATYTVSTATPWAFTAISTKVTRCFRSSKECSHVYITQSLHAFVLQRPVPSNGIWPLTTTLPQRTARAAALLDIFLKMKWNEERKKRPLVDASSGAPTTDRTNYEWRNASHFTSTPSIAVEVFLMEFT